MLLANYYGFFKFKFISLLFYQILEKCHNKKQNLMLLKSVFVWFDGVLNFILKLVLKDI